MRITKQIVAQKIAEIGASGTISYSDDNTIKFSNGAIIHCIDDNTRSKIYRVLTQEFYYSVTDPRMEDQDTIDGIIQAAGNGENPYNCTIMCSNPALNEVSR
jgi:hypothetical protein